MAERFIELTPIAHELLVERAELEERILELRLRLAGVNGKLELIQQMTTAELAAPATEADPVAQPPAEARP